MFAKRPATLTATERAAVATATRPAFAVPTASVAVAAASLAEPAATIAFATTAIAVAATDLVSSLS